LRQISFETLKPTGLARKHILQISLEGGILWLTVKEEATTLGIGVEIAPIGRQVIIRSNRQSRRPVNSVMSAGANKALALAKVDYLVRGDTDKGVPSFCPLKSYLCFIFSLYH
jgi:hypothetical protein